MGSLSDPSDVGAAPIGDQRFYGGQRTGQGRWAALPGLGILWTDDDNALQLNASSDATDRQIIVDLRYRLIAACRQGISASSAFDALVAEYEVSPVVRGDLSSLTA